MWKFELKCRAICNSSCYPMKWEWENLSWHVIKKPKNSSFFRFMTLKIQESLKSDKALKHKIFQSRLFFADSYVSFSTLRIKNSRPRHIQQTKISHLIYIFFLQEGKKKTFSKLNQLFTLLASSHCVRFFKPFDCEFKHYFGLSENIKKFAFSLA